LLLAARRLGFLFTHLFDNRFDEFGNRQKRSVVVAWDCSVSMIDFIGVVGIMSAETCAAGVVGVSKRLRSAGFVSSASRGDVSI
jgi:hypothetical protein